MRKTSSILNSDIMNNNETNVDRNSSEIYLCNEDDFSIIKGYHFWLKGIFVLCVAFTGFILNIIAVHILSTRNSMQNTFNSLLIFLFLIDCFYLVIEEVSSVQTILATTEENDDLITLLVPHFLYPMESVSLTASIFMTIGIAHERYVAIKSPIKHRQSMRSNGARRARLAKYIILVVFFSFSINVPKFFERQIIWVDPSGNYGNKSEPWR